MAKQPPRLMMLTTTCPICELNLEVDDIVLATVYPQQQNVPDEKGKRTPRVVAMMKPTLHFDCMLATRLQDVGLIVAMEDENATKNTEDGSSSNDSSDARASSEPSLASVSESNQTTDASTETNNDRTN